MDNNPRERESKEWVKSKYIQDTNTAIRTWRLTDLGVMEEKERERDLNNASQVWHEK